MSIWKLGTEWGSGKPSFYEYIRKKGIIISHQRSAHPKKGDYMLVTNGFEVLAIATLLEDAKPVTVNLDWRDEFAKFQIEFGEGVTYAAAKYRVLTEEERFDYETQKGIVKVHKDTIIQKVQTIMSQPDREIDENEICTAEDNETIYATAETGIEEEEENEVSDPFNPEDISIISQRIALETCLRRLEQGTINLNPDFQRKEVWDMTRKSQLIESLMLKIPLPMFYVSVDKKGVYTVVDGLQRLSTIRDFILGEAYLESRDRALKGDGFKLSNLEFWREYNGSTFNKLPIFIKNRILETEFSFTVINPGTPEEVKRNVFKRINTGGLPLSSQEIRNALYSGPSTQLLNELAEYESFKKATTYSIKPKRMDDKELILRFLAFWVRDYSSYNKTISIDSLLSNTMLIINAIPHNLNHKDLNRAVREGHIRLEDIRVDNIDSIKKAFDRGMFRASKLFGRHCFRKSYGNNRRTPVNKSLFEMWGVLLAQLDEKEFNTLVSNKSEMMKNYIKLLDDSDFQVMISKNSMSSSVVTKRFGKIAELIKDNIK